MTQDRFNKLIKWGSVAAVCLIVSPIVFMIVKGMVGLILVAGIASITGALIPAFSEWLTHLKYQSLKFVIDRAPVEALIQRAKERWEAIAEQRDLLKQQEATLALYKKKVDKIAIDFPEEEAAARANLAQYEQLFALRIEAFKFARAETEKFMRTIDKAEAIWDMAVAEANMGKSFGKNKDFMAVFREKTAFDAIDKASANAISELRMALIDNDYAAKTTEPVRAVTYDKNNNVMLGNILNVESIEVPVLKAQ
jgi:hypothetical protein